MHSNKHVPNISKSIVCPLSMNRNNAKSNRFIDKFLCVFHRDQLESTEDPRIKKKTRIL